MTDIKLSKIVGNAIARQRKIKDLTQAQVAEQLKMETETISRLENGGIAPTLKRMEQLSEIFDCPITSFFEDVRVNLSSQAQEIADLLEPLSKDERQSVLQIVGDMVHLLGKAKK